MLLLIAETNICECCFAITKGASFADVVISGDGSSGQSFAASDHQGSWKCLRFLRDAREHMSIHPAQCHDSLPKVANLMV